MYGVRRVRVYETAPAVAQRFDALRDGLRVLWRARMALHGPGVPRRQLV